MERWKLYIVECRGGELYVGVAQDVQQRVSEHNCGKACRYTKYRKPVKLKYIEEAAEYKQARQRERQVKKFSRKKKFELIKAFEKNRSLAPLGLEIHNFSKKNYGEVPEWPNGASC